MKTENHKNRSIRLVLLAVAAYAAVGCTGEFAEINRNPNEVTEEEIQRENYKTGANIKGLLSLVVPVEEHIYQFNELLVGGSYAGYVEGTLDGWDNKFSIFNPTADWLKWPFVNVLSETYPYYRGIVNGTDNAVMLALADVLRVAIMHRVTDTYGPIPYSEVVENRKESLAVGYDTQEEVRQFAEAAHGDAPVVRGSGRCAGAGVGGDCRGRHHGECRQCAVDACGEPGGSVLGRLGRSPGRGRHHLVDERL